MIYSIRRFSLSECKLFNDPATTPQPNITPTPGINPATTQPNNMGQWFKNAGQKTWNGVKTVGKIGLIGGAAATGLGIYGLSKAINSDD